MVNQICFGCGKILPPGSLKYVVQINVFADFDGVIQESELGEEDILSSEGTGSGIEQLLLEIQQMDPSKLENDVHQQMAFVLCPACKDKFLKNPIVESDSAQAPSKNSGIVH